MRRGLCSYQNGDGEADHLHIQNLQIDFLALEAVSSMLDVSLNAFPGSFVESLAFIYRDDANRLQVSTPIQSGMYANVADDDINALLHDLRENHQAEEIVGRIHTQPESRTLGPIEAGLLSVVDDNQATFGLDVENFAAAYIVTPDGDLLRFSQAGQLHAAANRDVEVPGTLVEAPGDDGDC